MNVKEAKQNIKTDWERQCYGMSVRDLEAAYGSYLDAKFMTKEIFVGGLLSDCQEMLEHGSDKDDIRKLLNVAKYFLFRDTKDSAAQSA